MKKLTNIICFVLLLSFSAANGQNITYQVNTDYLKLGDTTINLSNFNLDGLNVTVYGGTVASVSNLTNHINSGFDKEFGADAQSNLDFVVGLGTSTIFNPDSWGVINPTSGTGPVGGIADWSSRRDNLVAGNVPVMLIVTQPLGSLTVNDSWALVYANTVVPAAGSTVIGFTTGTGEARWSQDFIVGDNGSLILQNITPIPEPSTYALLFGIGTLGVILMRRRRK